MSAISEMDHERRIEELEAEVEHIKRWIHAMFPRPLNGHELHVGTGSGRGAQERVIAAYDALFPDEWRKG